MADFVHKAYGTGRDCTWASGGPASLAAGATTGVSDAFNTQGTGSTPIGLSSALYCDLELTWTFATTPAAGARITVIFLRSPDGGTNYPDGSSSVAAQGQDVVGAFEMRLVTSAQRRVLTDVPTPPGFFKVQLRNDGSTAASGTPTLKVWPHTITTV